MSAYPVARALLVHDARGANPVATRVTSGLDHVVDRVTSVEEALDLLMRHPFAYETVIVDVAEDHDLDLPAVELIAEAAQRASFVVIDDGADPAVSAFADAFADAHLSEVDRSTVAGRGDVASVYVHADEANSSPDDRTIQFGHDVYRTLVESTIDGIWVCDLEGTILFANAQMAQMLGHSRQEVEGRETFDFIASPLKLTAKAGLLRRRLGLSDVYELCLRTAEGGERWVFGAVTPLLGEDGVPVAAASCFTDVDKRQLLQRQLDAKKMGAIQDLAGGVAHDFNNLLTLIGGYATILRRGFDEGAPGFEEASEIERAARQGAALTRQLLTFSRQEMTAVQRTDVNEVITKLEDMLAHLVTDDVQILTRLDADPARVRADIGQLEEIVMNLCLNSRDAMPDGGTVVIETETVSFDHRVEHTLGSPGPQSYVRLSVSDSGIGMDERTRAKIFDPFFTTKAPDKGTGLGLSTVYGIVKQYDGFISVDSEPGQGTSIDIHLPCVANHDTPQPTQPHINPSQTTRLVETEHGEHALSRPALSAALQAYTD